MLVPAAAGFGVCGAGAVGGRAAFGEVAVDARQWAEVMKQLGNAPTGIFGAAWTSETSVTDGIRVSAVFGSVTNPSIALDRFFSRQQGLQDVAPVEVGPLGGAGPLRQR
jgi:hypothetical protein